MVSVFLRGLLAREWILRAPIYRVVVGEKLHRSRFI